ncbi:MAG: ATP-binding protein [Gammaproteobacteria bacterium]|jgi:PAS domain S-box-containing protein|nr:ATP-binding protein [Gammaproteobacteria bacterium]
MTKASDPQAEILRLALHAAPSGIMVVGEGGEIVFANQTLADMFGHRLQELLGQPVEILLPEQHGAAHRRHVESYARHPEPRPMGAGKDFEAISKDGRRFPVEIGLRPAPTNAGRTVVATVIDISQRKAIEERLRKHEEQLEQLVAERTRELRQAQLEKERVLEHLIQAEKMTAIGTLVSGIGHEINNPLYVLSATAEALTEEEDLARCHAYGHEILKQARNIAETVKNLSRYAQPSARYDLQHVDVNASISGAVRLAKRSFRSDGIEIKATASPAPPILAKPEEIQQVVFNIIRNGIQAIGDKGLIEIRTGQEAGWVTVRIRDTGAGIPEEHLKQVFDPFFTTKGPHEGEGLGLYIVRQIVTQYGGMIDAENAVGGGAVFVIRFPLAGQRNAEGRHI